jgi:tetratricopeptide (TPR) repeat protein
MSRAGPVTGTAEAAYAAYRDGNRDQAERLYGEALSQNPKDAAALQGLGALRFEQGRKQEAIGLLGRAAALAPASAGIRRNHAAALASSGCFAEAAEEYRAALAIEPDVATDWGRLGSVLAALDRNDEAIAAYQAALEKLPPDAAERAVLLRRLGQVQRSAGQTDEAIAAWRSALALAPHHAGVAFNLGNAFKDAGRNAEAEQAYRQALTIDPRLLRAQVNLGAVLHKEGRLEEAEVAFRTALALDPAAADARRNLAIVLNELNRGEEALRALEPLLADGHGDRETLYVAAVVYQGLHLSAQALDAADRLLAIDPEDVQALGGRALALLGLDRREEALAAAGAAKKRAGGDANALNNAGVVFRTLGAVEEAIDCFRAAVALKPDFADAHSSLGVGLLSQGSFADGWAEYEWRWQTRDFRRGLRRYETRRWRGDPRPDSTLLVYAEQGFGDTLQFARLLAPAAKRVGRLLFETQPELVRVMQGLPGAEHIIARGDPMPSFDLQIPLLSLPAVLRFPLDAIPGSVPYLSAEPQLAASWAQRLQSLPRPRIGLVWQGNPRHPNDRNRSIGLALLKPLIERFEAGWVSLQKVGGAEAIEAQGLAGPIFDPTAELEDFAATAALCANLDLVIAVDTSVAHLAGALGRPTLLLLPAVPDSRWLLVRSDTPWYPSMRLFRQRHSGDWSDPLAELERAVADFGRACR